MKRSILLLFLFLLPLYLYSQVDYVALEEEVNRLRTDAGRTPIYLDQSLSEMAKLQVNAMIAHNKMEHLLYDLDRVDDIDRSLRKQYGHDKSYIHVRIYELIAVREIDEDENVERVIANVYNHSSDHVPTILEPMAKAIGWHVRKHKGVYWIATYILARYYG